MPRPSADVHHATPSPEPAWKPSQDLVTAAQLVVQPNLPSSRMSDILFDISPRSSIRASSLWTGKSSQVVPLWIQQEREDESNALSSDLENVPGIRAGFTQDDPFELPMRSHETDSNPADENDSGSDSKVRSIILESERHHLWSPGSSISKLPVAITGSWKAKPLPCERRKHILIRITPQIRAQRPPAPGAIPLMPTDSSGSVGLWRPKPRVFRSPAPLWRTTQKLVEPTISPSHVTKSGQQS